MKKIISFVMLLVMLMGLFVSLPVFAQGGARVSVYLDEGFSIIYLDEQGEETVYPVAAKNMADRVEACGLSIQDYALRMLEGDVSDVMRTLLQAMLDYGAAARKYFNYKPEDDQTPILGRPVTDTAALKAADAPDAEAEDESGIYIGATLILEGTMQLHFYFNGDAGSASVNGEAASVTTGDGYYYIDVPVMPYAMSESVTVRVGDTTVKYAPVNYLKNKADDNSLSYMVASIYAYGVAAEEYARSEMCKHSEDMLTSVDSRRTPTFFSEGYVRGTCSCGQYVSIRLPRTEVDTIICDGSTEKVYYGRTSLEDLTADGTHFYPTGTDTDGKSLFIEFSMLVNETFLNSVAGGYKVIDLLYFTDAKCSYNSTNFPIIFHADGNDCCPVGSFDARVGDDEADVGHDKVEYFENDVVTPQYGKGKYSYTLKSLYGWHRFGIKLSESVSVDRRGRIEYKMYATLYVDGVEVYTADVTSSEPKGWISDNYLYDASYDGDLSYSDTENDRYIYAFVLEGFAATQQNICVPVADAYVSCGDDFVIPVRPVAEPAQNSFVTDGYTLDGRIYYTVAD